MSAACDSGGVATAKRALRASFNSLWAAMRRSLRFIMLNPSFQLKKYRDAGMGENGMGLF
jgi:hypothetical protein